MQQDLSRILPRYPIELPAVFEDRRGREDVVILNGGNLLRTTIRGVALSGPSFDTLEPDSAGANMPLDIDEGGWLATGVFTVAMTVPAIAAGSTVRLPLSARIDLASRPNPVALALDLPDGAEPIHGIRHGGDFDAELADIVAQLPPGVHLLCCYTCGLADYSPTGRQLFGDLYCFRDTADRYRATRSKFEFFPLMPLATEIVQETHLCPVWEVRPRGRGYRG